MRTLLIPLLLLLLGSCQEKLDLTLQVEVGDTPYNVEEERFTYEEIMPLTGNLSPHPQGGDCWGDYFFQFVNNNTAVRIYDLDSRTLIQTAKIAQRGFVSSCHCNSVCFGPDFYAEGDEFPLIYVSTGYASGGYTGSLVYRITRVDDQFSFTLVQTLKFPVDKSSWTEFIPTDDGFGLLCYTSERVIFKVRLPKVEEGDLVIDRSQALETFQFTPQPDWMKSSRNQDRLFYRGKLVFVSGVPQSGEASVFVMLNFETLEREKILDLKEIGLRNESESIFVWRGDLCVAFVDRIVRLYF